MNSIEADVISLSLHLQCLHESTGIAEKIEVPDYFPPSEGEIEELMMVATSTNDPQLIAKIQIRLSKTIPGKTCPYSIDGPIGVKLSKLDELFVNETRYGRSQDFIDKF